MLQGVWMLFFVLPDSIPLYRHTTFCFSIHHLIDIWTDSTFWQVQMVLPWTCVYKHLCRRMFSFSVSQYLGVERLGHTINLCLTFGKLSNSFPKCPQNFCVHQQWMRSTVSPCAHRHFCILQPSCCVGHGATFFWLSRYYLVLPACWGPFWERPNKMRRKWGRTLMSWLSLSKRSVATGTIPFTHQ